MLYDEDEAEAAIKALPRSARMHLSHVVRNGMSNVLSALKCGCTVKGVDCGAERELREMEARWKALGL